MRPLITILKGRAGSGKTERCIEEARKELLATCEGKPLLFLAPKQATYQIERGLLAGGLSGFARLHILSFERLAHWIFKQTNQKPPTIDTLGRQLIVQSLLAQLHKELKVYKKIYTHAGFVDEICNFIEETSRRKIDSARLKARAGSTSGYLQAKLLDLAKILGAYESHLKQNGLIDPARLLDIAAEAWEASNLEFQQIWLDGFASLTPQEMNLLNRLTHRAEKVTLAFCVSPEAQKRAIGEWNPTLDAIQSVRDSVHGVGELREETLREQHRFSADSALRHLEEKWDSTIPVTGNASEGAHLLQCTDPEAEAIAAAHAILEHVRRGGRFRETAVLPRNLQDYGVVFKRVFLRYKIPFFLDTREPVINHPLVRLTKCALRLATGPWEAANLLSILKCGLCSISAEQVDHLENALLEKGIDGKELKKQELYGERDFNLCIQPIIDLEAKLEKELTGTEIAECLRQLWKKMKVPTALQSLCEKEETSEPFHNAVWKQLDAWLDQISSAFETQTLASRDWSSLIEASLSSLTVGLIPPSLDQVLIGSIERSRNPDLKLAIIPGCNDAVFPQLPGKPNLFSTAETSALKAADLNLAQAPQDIISRERFLGYIAFTRARELLVVTYSQKGFAGEPLEKSFFVEKLTKLLPNCGHKHFEQSKRLEECKHACEAEVLATRFRIKIAETERVLGYADNLATPVLPPDIARKLFGNPFKTSISHLEKFAACRHQFFLMAGLRLKERKESQITPLEKGDYQHRLLSEFHRALKERGLTWHSVSKDTAANLLKDVAEREKEKLPFASLTRREQNKFLAGALERQALKLIEAMIDWMKTYSFEPSSTEISFGYEKSELPAVEIPLEDNLLMQLVGKIDRLDTYSQNGTEYAVVVDYKTSEKQFEPKEWYNGLQIQLPVYLLALKKKNYVPVGMFYIQIKDKREKVPCKDDECKASPYKHFGRFKGGHIDLFDAQLNGQPSGQFNYRPTKGGFHKSTKGPMTDATFAKLLELTYGRLVETGHQVLNGEISVNPYKEACERCSYSCICRIDKWAHKFRELEQPTDDQKL